MSGEWDGDIYVAEDGRSFAIFSELVRGEPRFYEVKERVYDKSGERTLSSGGENWKSRHLPFDVGSYDKRTLRRRVERYVAEAVRGYDPEARR